MSADLDAALLRWSAVVRTWQETSAGHQPELGPFLAGWFLRLISDAEHPPDVDGFRDSFRAGWKESEMHLEILRREAEAETALLAQDLIDNEDARESAHALDAGAELARWEGIRGSYT